MTLEAPVADCQGRITHTDDQLERMRLIARRTQPDVRPYLQEALCCFGVGAYRGSVVSAWCGAGARLRTILGSFGHEIYTPHLTQVDLDRKKSVTDIDGGSLLEPIDHLQALPSEDVKGLSDLWRVRCRCAHPSDEVVGPDDVIRLLGRVANFFSRAAATETIRNVGALYSTLVSVRRLESVDADRWLAGILGRIYPPSLTSLCDMVCGQLLSAPGEGLPDKRRLRVIWRALLWPSEPDADAIVGGETRSRLLRRVVMELERADFDGVLDASELLDGVVRWSDVPGLGRDEQDQLFKYMHVHRDDLARNDKRRIATYVPPEVRSRVLEVWPDAGSDEGSAA